MMEPRQHKKGQLNHPILKTESIAKEYKDRK